MKTFFLTLTCGSCFTIMTVSTILAHDGLLAGGIAATVAAGCSILAGWALSRLFPNF